MASRPTARRRRKAQTCSLWTSFCTSPVGVHRDLGFHLGFVEWSTKVSAATNCEYVIEVIGSIERNLWNNSQYELKALRRESLTKYLKKSSSILQIKTVKSGAVETNTRLRSSLLWGREVPLSSFINARRRSPYAKLAIVTGPKRGSRCFSSGVFFCLEA